MHKDLSVLKETQVLKVFQDLLVLKDLLVLEQLVLKDLQDLLHQLVLWNLISLLGLPDQLTKQLFQEEIPTFV